MFHYTKSFSTFARDYGIQEGSGLPALHEGVVPVSLVDDRSEYVLPNYPTYVAKGEQAAVAAVYALAGIFVPPAGNPVRLLGVWGEQYTTQFTLGIVSLITANAGTFTPAGLARGSTMTTQGLTGTTTVDPAGLDYMATFLLSTIDGSPPADALRGLILRPGEYFWANSLGVNTQCELNMVFEELLFPIVANPSAL